MNCLRVIYKYYIYVLLTLQYVFPKIREKLLHNHSTVTKINTDPVLFNYNPSSNAADFPTNVLFSENIS